ncbi:hypothetical protein Tco_1235921 [Tanacetum coccineum]
MENSKRRSIPRYVSKFMDGDLKMRRAVLLIGRSAIESIFLLTLSAEAEYIAAYDASKESIWVRKFMYGLAKESGITKGARHFCANVHYLHEVIKFGDIMLEKVYTDDNLADPFTKALSFLKHSKHTMNIGMLPASSFMQVYDD